MTRLTLAGAVAGLTLGATVQAITPALDTVTAARIGLSTDESTLSVAEFVVTPTLSAAFGEQGFAKATLRARADLADELEPGRPVDAFRDRLSQRWLAGDSLDIELRELYADLGFGDHVLRLGKQAVVWGEADGLKVLDVVNPQSFREFILADFDESRIPLWSANLELALDGASTLQLLWVPDRTYHDIPDRDARFAFTSPLLVPELSTNVPVRLRAAQTPRRFLADSDAGLRYSTFRGGWELSLNYFYHYDDTPALRIGRDAQGLIIRPEYERTHLAGGTFNYASGAFVVRGELGYTSARVVRNRTAPSGVRRHRELAWVLGLDYDGRRDTFISAQLFQSALLDHRSGTVRDALENTVSLLARREFRNDTISTELLALHALNDQDGVLQLALTWQWRSNIDLRIGADLFYGARDGLFGQFKREDRITFGVELGF